MTVHGFDSNESTQVPGDDGERTNSPSSIEIRVQLESKLNQVTNGLSNDGVKRLTAVARHMATWPGMSR